MPASTSSSRKKAKTTAGPVSQPMATRRSTRQSQSHSPGPGAVVASTSGTPLSTRGDSVQEEREEEEGMSWEQSQDGFEYSDDGDDDDQMAFETPKGGRASNSKEVLVLSHDEDDEEEEDGRSGRRSSSRASLVVLSSDEDDTPASPPARATPVSKGKMSSRKQYAADCLELIAEYGSKEGELVRDFKKQGDEAVQFTIVHPGFKSGLQLVIMLPDAAGYPTTHQSVICYSESLDEVPVDIQGILQELQTLPAHTNRSLRGMLQYLISRIVYHEPSPYPVYLPLPPSNSQSQSHQNETDDESTDAYYDSLFGIGDTVDGQTAGIINALRRDFAEIINAGFRPGFTRVSELDNIVSVSKRVNTLGVPLRALESWDSNLITNKVRYLVLLINFGSKYPPNLDDGHANDVSFRVGLCPRYKPSKEAVAAAFRSHSANPYTENEFESISLSKPLESLFNDHFQHLLLTRRSNVNVGWAAAEDHCLTPGRKPNEPVRRASKEADNAEKAKASSYQLSEDPMRDGGSQAHNYPLLAFSYLVRRFVMCPAFCLICYKKIETEFAALKPFVCTSALCLFQLFALGLGPSLEHEIKTNAPAVDLLVQLAFCAASEGSLTEQLQPVGLALEVPDPAGGTSKDFDALDVATRNKGIVALISELPSISSMKAWLCGDDQPEHEKSLMIYRKLKDMPAGNGNLNGVSSSAWQLLRWIIASNTSYLKQIEEEDERIGGVPKTYRQFRLVVGSPDKDFKFSEAVKLAKTQHARARTYPTLYAWHGSPVKNWHSILRQSLHYNQTLNGRAYGNGVYFAKQGELSLGTYAVPASSSWRNADYAVQKLAAICEVVNAPAAFVSSNPYFVVAQLEWIQCRYLIVQTANTAFPAAGASTATAAAPAPQAALQLTQPVPLDPAHPLSLNQTPIAIPDVLPKLQAMARKLEGLEEGYDAGDLEIFKEPVTSTPAPSSSRKRPLKALASYQSVDSDSTPKARGKGKGNNVAPPPPSDPFAPASDAIISLIRLLPPPSRPSAGASLNIQREMRSMLAEQEKDGPSTCGFYFDPERSEDNIFTWVVEMLGFDPELPIAQDLKAKNVGSLLFEIRFPESFPLSPPFFRLVYPRLLPFARGGGGHVTLGGSICMDLLTSDGWSPAYNISAVLLQIRMAISSLDPHPARLDPKSWATPYSMHEAVDGFKRAARTHGWKVPPELDALTRGS